MEKTTRIVYLEDIEKPATAKIAENQAVTITTAEVAVADTTAPSVVVKTQLRSTTVDKKENGSMKRQRTIADMLASSPSSSTLSPPAAKRAKTTPAEQTGQKLNAIPFSMSEYMESLSDEEKKYLALECETMGKSWLKMLKDEMRRPYFIDLKKFLFEQGVRGPKDSATKLTVYPPPKDIYSWSYHTALGRVKVVIIGQDPYHGPGQAHGLSFSVPPGVSIPPSLRNIYKEIKAEYPSFEPPAHGNLTAWAENGVLLLNTALTVKAREAGSHSGKGWEQFTEKVVELVARYGGANLGSKSAGVSRGVVFLAWGAWAAKRVAKLDKKKHLILTSAHPSPFSANRGFLGNGHFKKANDWLAEKYGPDGCVDWTKL